MMATLSTRAGLPLIRHFEGCKLTAYPDPGTGGEPWTIGWGQTGGIKRGQTITQAQADAWLLATYDKFEAAVSKLVTVQLTQNQLGALVCFAYNVGLGNLKASTLLKRINTHDNAGAAGEFGRWNKAAGRVLNGLTTRRAAEAALFARA